MRVELKFTRKYISLTGQTRIRSPICYGPLQEEEYSKFSTIALDCVGSYNILPGFLLCLTGK